MGSRFSKQLGGNSAPLSSEASSLCAADEIFSRPGAPLLKTFTADNECGLLLSTKQLDLPFHSRGHVHGVAPDIEAPFVETDDPRCQWPRVHADSDSQAGFGSVSVGLQQVVHAFDDRPPKCCCISGVATVCNGNTACHHVAIPDLRHG